MEGFGIRLNKQPPHIIFKKKEKGGINFTSTVHLTQIDEATVKAILTEYKIHNADVHFRADASADELIDLIEGNRYSFIIILIISSLSNEKKKLHRLCAGSLNVNNSYIELSVST